MKKGFTLIEMLVVIGIIAVLTGVGIASYTRVLATAEKTRAQELVSNVATALSAMYQREGMWPKRLVTAAMGDNLLDQDAAFPLGKKKYLSMDLDADGTRLEGYDRFGIVSPWALTAIKSRSGDLSDSMKVDSSGKTVLDHTLRFAIDLDGDGITELPDIDGDSGSKRVRAVACVWCCSKEGSLKYRDIVKSWTQGQVEK